jgi:hypothetical protein
MVSSTLTIENPIALNSVEEREIREVVVNLLGRLGIWTIPWPTPDIDRISRGAFYGFSVREFPPR